VRSAGAVTLSAPVKLKLAAALAETDSGAGPSVMLVVGGVVSTVQVRGAGVGSALPAWSIARTWTVWLPSARGPARGSGLVQAANAASSSWHSNVRSAGAV